MESCQRKLSRSLEVFVTIDHNLPYQQELSKYSIAVIALKAKSNRYKVLLGFVESASEAIKIAEVGKFYEIAPSNE